MKKYIDRVDWKKCNGLLPVIVQESSSKDVLMMAFMNEEALELTIKSGYAHYFSRTKQRIWKKGESSGNVQIIKDISIDCDNDTLLIKIEQVGGIACHTGRKSCFFTNLKTLKSKGEIDESATLNYSIIDKLYHVIKERKHEDPSKSYVASLFNKGENAYLKKVIEESGEFCFALKDGDEKEIVYEAADLVFHLLVALGDKNIDPDRVKQELSRRFGLSGIEEKNSRDESFKSKTEYK